MTVWFHGWLAATRSHPASFERAIPSCPVVLTPQTHFSNHHTMSLVSTSPPRSTLPWQEQRNKRTNKKNELYLSILLLTHTQTYMLLGTSRTTHGLYRCEAAGQQSFHLGQNRVRWRVFADRNLQSSGTVGNRPIQSLD